MTNVLNQISATLLNGDSSPAELRACAHNLHEKLHQWSGLSIHSSHCPIAKNEWTQDSYLDDGEAISPHSAGLCIIEYARTAAFVRGIHQAIQDKLKHTPHRPLQILYAGTGPFAPLALCQMPLFSAEDIQFTFLDIHPFSLNCVRTILKELDCETFVSDYVQQDAVQYQPDKKFDLIISEVMQRALAKEPQVAVTENLSNHLAQNGIFIPEQVDVSFCLLDPNHEFRFIDDKSNPKDESLYRKRYAKTTLMEFRGDRKLDVNQDGTMTLPGITLPDSIEDRLHPYFSTEIQVYKQHTLKEYDCSLTLPEAIKTPFQIEPKTELKATFHKGKKPGITLSGN